MKNYISQSVRQAPKHSFSGTYLCICCIIYILRTFFNFMWKQKHECKWQKCILRISPFGFSEKNETTLFVNLDITTGSLSERATNFSQSTAGHCFRKTKFVSFSEYASENCSPVFQRVVWHLYMWQRTYYPAPFILAPFLSIQNFDEFSQSGVFWRGIGNTTVSGAYIFPYSSIC